MNLQLKSILKKHIRPGSLAWKGAVKAQHFLRWVQRAAWSLKWALHSGRLRNLNGFEFKVYSQNGEDGILQAVFRTVGPTNRFAVEFGIGDGTECNTRYLHERQGWQVLQMDSSPTPGATAKQEFITAENINAVFEKYAVPYDFDLLSIDVDGNDYWLWRALDAHFRPRVVLVEYNAKIPPAENKSVAYDPDFRWDGSDYFGASLGALNQLAESKSYQLVGCDSSGVNAFFVRKDLADAYFIPSSIERLYRPPQYGSLQDSGGWPRSNRAMISLE